MRTDEVAAALNVSKTVVWRQIRAKRLPATKFGRDWMVRQEDFEAFSRIKRDRGRPRTRPTPLTPPTPPPAPPA